MKYFPIRINFSAALCLIFLFFAPMAANYAQSPADSLEIYDPFVRPTHIPRLLDSYFSILGKKESALVKQYQAELAEAEKQRDQKQSAELLLKLGDLYLRGDNSGMALITYFKGLRIAEEIRDTLLRGLLSIRVGRTYSNSEILLETEYTAKGAALLRNVKDPEIQAIVKYALCTIEPDPAKSGEYGREALRLQLEVMNRKPDDTIALENLSKYLNATGRFEEAIAAAEKAGSARLIVYYLNNYGSDKQKKGKYSEALALYTRAVRLCKEDRLKGLLSNTYSNLGLLYNQMGEYKKAAKYIELYALAKESLYRENYARHYAENIVRYEMEAKEMANAYLKLEKEKLEEALSFARMLEVFLLIALCGVITLVVMGYFGRKELKMANNLLVEQKNQIDSSRLQLETTHRELQESEANLNAAQELAQVANWEWNLSENKFSFSEMLPKIFGIPKEEIKSNFRNSILSVIHSDDHRQVWNDFTKNQWDPGEYEIRYRILRGGEIRWLRAHYKCIAYQDGGNIKINGTIQDITLLQEKEESRIKIEAERLFAAGLVDQQEAERKRIAFEIHDGIGQEIVAMKNQAELALTERDPVKASADCLQQFVRTMPELLQQLRRISQNLRPVHLERMGLTETLRELVRQAEKSSTIKFIVDIKNIDNLLPVEKELHVFRIAQEALNNISKHSGARHVNFNIVKKGRSIEMLIRDDGKGFNVETLKEEGSGFGLQSMEGRAAMLGAGLLIKSQNGAGMSLVLTIPVEEDGK